MGAFNDLLGLAVGPKDLTFVQIAIRGAIVFIAALVMVRLGDKRFLSKKTPLDAVLGFVLASMMARAINGSAAFWPTIGGGFVIVLLHRIAAHLSRRFHPLGKLVKGSSDLVVQNGQIIEAGLRKNDFSREDLAEDLRLNGVESVEKVHTAYIERNGDLSVVKK